MINITPISLKIWSSSLDKYIEHFFMYQKKPLGQVAPFLWVYFNNLFDPVSHTELKGRSCVPDQLWVLISYQQNFQ